MASLQNLRLVGRAVSAFRKPSALARALSTRPQLQDGTSFHEVGSSYYETDFPSFREHAVRESPQFKFPPKGGLTLDGFLEKLPNTLNLRQEILSDDSSALLGKDDPVLVLFRKLKLSRKDWAPYAHFDPTRTYTRNLIHTDHENYTLLLLCWNAGAESKIHDHPCDGCWLQVLQGEIQECRYEYPASTEGRERLECIADERFQEGQVAFINDNIGLHKVGNPCPSVPAVTLHLYHPPFQDCKVWDNSAASSASKSCCADHFSEYGQVLSR